MSQPASPAATLRQKSILGAPQDQVAKVANKKWQEHRKDGSDIAKMKDEVKRILKREPPDVSNLAAPSSAPTTPKRSESGASARAVDLAATMPSPQEAAQWGRGTSALQPLSNIGSPTPNSTTSPRTFARLDCLKRDLQSLKSQSAQLKQGPRANKAIGERLRPLPDAPPSAFFPDPAAEDPSPSPTRNKLLTPLSPSPAPVQAQGGGMRELKTLVADSTRSQASEQEAARANLEEERASLESELAAVDKAYTEEMGRCLEDRVSLYKKEHEAYKQAIEAELGKINERDEYFKIRDHYRDLLTSTQDGVYGAQRSFERLKKIRELNPPATAEQLEEEEAERRNERLRAATKAGLISEPSAPFKFGPLAGVKQVDPEEEKRLAREALEAELGRTGFDRPALLSLAGLTSVVVERVEPPQREGEHRDNEEPEEPEPPKEPEECLSDCPALNLLLLSLGAVTEDDLKRANGERVGGAEAEGEEEPPAVEVEVDTRDRGAVDAELREDPEEEEPPAASGFAPGDEERREAEESDGSEAG